ncbi:4Fe-4S cluster-binding domain-containing protein [Candidatus Pacearchaeota archaeon]|nr:4Fe-4S cluster-binding domain-containing protein [Candidatus Pacearchaeota archaeon]
MKTKFNSYCINDLPNGCKYCVKGEKLVLFISGICSRNCKYCSLSKKRKNKDIIYANEKICKNVKECIKEAELSHAKGAGITGGDPLLFLKRTISYAKSLKKHFKNFHIHIYLPTKLVTGKKLEKLSSYIDEVRFHPEFLIKKPANKDKEKIELASLYWKKENIGCELPCIPDKKEEIANFIKEISAYVGFVNLNEFEISETNFNCIKSNYKLNPDTYTIKDSIKSGIWIINKCKNLGIKIHLCTAKTKNINQYVNRLKLRECFPYGKKTSEGTVVYFAIYSDNAGNITKHLKKQGYSNMFYIDKERKRILLSQKIVRKLIEKYRIKKVEEFPTSDHIEIESEYLS